MLSNWSITCKNKKKEKKKPSPNIPEHNKKKIKKTSNRINFKYRIQSARINKQYFQKSYLYKIYGNS